MKRFSAALLMLLPIAFANAASFDCSKAKSLVEQAICSNGKLSELDESLDVTYRDALAGASTPTELKADQRKWMTEIRNKCVDAACISQAYVNRISLLNSQVSTSLYSGDLRSLMGTYDNRDKYRPGELKLLPLSATRLKFELHSEYLQANGNVNVGNETGEVNIKDGVATFVSKEDDCQLIFKFFGKNVTVWQHGSCGMGMGVYGDGTYVLVNRAKPVFTPD